MKPRNIFISWDFISASLIALVSYFLLQPSIHNDFAKDLYGIGISVLAIVFSVYFAALAIIISSGDNDFLEYLEKKGFYSVIISVFRFSLMTLFIALVYSIFVYTITSFWLSNQVKTQSIWYFCIFTFLFPYSLFATTNSSLDAINYSRYRVKFLLFKQQRTLETKEGQSEIQRLN
jgi:hypothetical protein